MGNREVNSFIVYPEVKKKATAVVVIHEINGLTDWVQSLTDQLAEAGYIAIAPDLLSGMGPGGGGTSAFTERNAVGQAIRDLPPDQITADLNAVAEYVSKVPAANGKVAVSGFCWGGSQTYAADQTRLQRFIQEAKAASGPNHPNILTVYEIGQTDSIHFIASEYIEGETLRHHLSNLRISLNEVLDICIQVTNALTTAHKAGIIHRDMKPENIMIRRDGIVKALDFGLAKLTAHESADVNAEAPTKAIIKTDPGMVLGTAIYMSPEQARGITVDARTDIFSVGVVLYEMVTGCLPFAGSTSSEVLASILSEKEPPPLARYSREAPAELERVVSKALRKNRDERYQTIKDFLLDLKSLKQELEFAAKLERSTPPELGGAGGAAKPTDGRKVSTEPGESAVQTAVEGGIKRHRVGSLLALAALVAVAAAVAYLSSPARPCHAGNAP